MCKSDMISTVMDSAAKQAMLALLQLPGQQPANQAAPECEWGILKE